MILGSSGEIGRKTKAWFDRATLPVHGSVQLYLKGDRMVELRGIEPLTSSLRTRRSPN